MQIEKVSEEAGVRLAVSGSLTAVTAEQLSAAIDPVLDETKKLILDFKDLEFLASAGLRVIIATKKKLDALKGAMVIRNVCEAVMDVFEVTGLDDILDFE